MHWILCSLKLPRATLVICVIGIHSFDFKASKVNKERVKLNLNIQFWYSESPDLSETYPLTIPNNNWGKPYQKWFKKICWASCFQIFSTYLKKPCCSVNAKKFFSKEIQMEWHRHTRKRIEWNYTEVMGKTE